MARQRRGGSGGFRGPELRGTLGTLLRTTLQQAGVVREALERGAREGRSRLDDLRTNRRRTDALAELGELVLDLIRQGEIDLDELPEARALVRFLDELDEADGGHRHAHSHDHDHDHDHDHHDHDHDHGHHDHDHRDHDHHDRQPARSRDASGRGDRTTRATLDDRSAAARRSADASDRPRRSPDDNELAEALRPATRQRFDDRSTRNDRATRDDRPMRTDRSRDDRSRDDGTVSSKRWSPPRPTSPGTPRVWRPPVDDAPDATDEPHDPPPRRPAMPPNPHRKGGISFDSDDDLADYMHPDDVPPKPRPDGES